MGWTWLLLSGLRFEMEISHLDHLESSRGAVASSSTLHLRIYVVRFRRESGEMTTYKELCSKVLSEMKI